MPMSHTFPIVRRTTTTTTTAPYVTIPYLYLLSLVVFITIFIKESHSFLLLSTKNKLSSWKTPLNPTTFTLPTPSLSLDTSSSSTSTTTDDLTTINDNGRRQFMNNLSSSLQNDSFVSITLYGKKISKTTLKNDKFRYSNHIKLIDGRLISLLERKKKRRKTRKNKTTTTTAVAEPSHRLYLQMTFKYYGATDVVKNWDIISRSSDDDDNDNDDCEAIRHLRTLLFTNVSSISETYISRATLHTTTSRYKLTLHQGSPSRLHHSLLTTNTTTTTTTNNNNNNNNIHQHDRIKSVPLNSHLPFLHQLGLTDANGKTKRGMTSKLRQCRRFVEIIAGLIPPSLTKSSDDSRPLRIVDMGCGRGYLTFGLHSHLSESFVGGGGVVVTTVGVEVRQSLVEEVTGIARELGGEFENLNFVTGTIDDCLVVSSDDPDASRRGDGDDDGDDTSSSSSRMMMMNQKPDILVALHACDTATDDSIYYGIKNNATIIVCAPCCHNEVRTQMDTFVRRQQLTTSSSSSSSSSFSYEILRYGIHRERTAEMVTDTMRALLLEMAGYDVQVFEFIGGEHTGKNVMITAVKNNKKTTTMEGRRVENARQRLVSLARCYGVTRQKLAGWMSVSLSEKMEEGVVVDDEEVMDDDDDDVVGGRLERKKARVVRSAKKMPPMIDEG